MFPAEQIPDGALMAPHHYLYGAYLTIVCLLVVWNDYESREPLLVILAVGISLFGWAHVWKPYPVPGALMTLAGLAVALVVVTMGWHGYWIGDVWDEYDVRWRWATLFFLLVALDDAISHSFGVWTPLDWLWKIGGHRIFTGFSVLGL